MKKISILIAVVVFFAACKQHGKGTFVVSGTIQHIQPNTVVYLEELPLEDKAPVTLDSFIVKDNKGEFKVRGIAKQEGLYRIRMSGYKQEIRIINDDNDIKVVFDVDNSRHPEITGSSATKSLYLLFEECYKKDSIYVNAATALDSAQHLDSMQLVTLHAAKENIVKEKNAAISEYISKSPSPVAVCYATFMATNSMTPQEIIPIFSVAAKKFGDHPGILFTQKMLAKANVRDVEDASKETAYPLLNQQAPELSMADANGKTVKISDFKGKYVLVDFWASWCKPCRAENPNVVAAYNKFKNKNFTVLGVSLDESKDSWVAAIAQDQLTWAHMSDLKQWESAAINAYQFNSIPFNVLIDPQGKIIASGLRGEKLEQMLQSLLK